MPYAEYESGKIYYETKGSGEPLIFIHGVGLDHTIWNKQVDYFSSKYKVIVYDMLGHGGSEHPPGPYSLKQYVEQLKGLMDFLHIEKAHVIGFSMGGMVVQAFALTYKERLKTITILNSVCNRTKEQRDAVLNRVEEVKKVGPEASIEPAIKRWFTSSFIEENEGVINNIRTRLETNNPTSYLAAYTLFATADRELWDQLQNIEVPTFIMTSENDIGSTPEMAKQMHEKINGSSMKILPTLRHMSPIEGAEIVNNELRLFLESHSTSK